MHQVCLGGAARAVDKRVMTAVTHGDRRFLVACRHQRALDNRGVGTLPSRSLGKLRNGLNKNSSPLSEPFEPVRVALKESVVSASFNEDAATLREVSRELSV